MKPIVIWFDIDSETVCCWDCDASLVDCQGGVSIATLNLRVAQHACPHITRDERSNR